MHQAKVLSSTPAVPSSCNDTDLDLNANDLLLSLDHPAASCASRGSRGAAIDAAVHRFPFCLVWSPIPILTWFLPFIGHLGLADSNGVIFDFAGPYTIGRDAFTFGAPTRYIQCHVAPEDVVKWDEAVAAGCEIYSKRTHNLCCDNCHSHVAVCLEHVQYAGQKRWNMAQLCLWMFLRGKYVNLAAFVKTWLPFVFIILREKPKVDPLLSMLAYALAQTHVQVEAIEVHSRRVPSSPLTSPRAMNPDVVIQIESDEEEDDNDGIDFGRLRAELDRLLEEGLHESDDESDESFEDVIIDVCYQVHRPCTTAKIYSADRISRSL